MSTAQESNENPAYLVILFDVQTERLKEFTEIMAGVKGAMQSEEGFEDAFVLQDMDEPNQFVLVERWQSKHLHMEHFDRIVKSGEWESIGNMLSSSPVMKYTNMLSNK